MSTAHRGGQFDYKSSTAACKWNFLADTLPGISSALLARARGFIDFMFIFIDSPRFYDGRRFGVPLGTRRIYRRGSFPFSPFVSVLFRNAQSLTPGSGDDFSLPPSNICDGQTKRNARPISLT